MQTPTTDPSPSNAVAVAAASPAALANSVLLQNLLSNTTLANNPRAILLTGATIAFNSRLESIAAAQRAANEASANAAASMVEIFREVAASVPAEENPSIETANECDQFPLEHELFCQETEFVADAFGNIVDGRGECRPPAAPLRRSSRRGGKCKSSFCSPPHLSLLPFL
jgi:hypothetical protein